MFQGGDLRFNSDKIEVGLLKIGLKADFRSILPLLRRSRELVIEALRKGYGCAALVKEIWRSCDR